MTDSRDRDRLNSIPTAAVGKDITESLNRGDDPTGRSRADAKCVHCGNVRAAHPVVVPVKGSAKPFRCTEFRSVADIVDERKEQAATTVNHSLRLADEHAGKLIASIEVAIESAERDPVLAAIVPSLQRIHDAAKPVAQAIGALHRQRAST